MITLLGATGHTGRRVARALDRAGLPYRLAGRSPDELMRLSAMLRARPAWHLADATQPETVAALCPGSRVLVNCAGPFTDLGEAVLAQAAQHGVHYLDTTNELAYVYQVQGYDARARQHGAAVVPACGFEVALSDCAAAVLADGLAYVDEVSVAYDLKGQGSSPGTRRSAVRALATSWLGYRDGQWVHAAPGRQVRRIELPGGPRRALSFPSSEIVTVPQRMGAGAVGQVTAWLAVPQAAALVAPVLVPAFAWLARGPVGRAAEALLARALPPPPAGPHSRSPFTVQVEVRAGSTARRMTFTGGGVYDLTAEIVAYAAAELAAEGYDRAGVLAPAAALRPRALLDRAAAQWGVTVRQDERADRGAD